MGQIREVKIALRGDTLINRSHYLINVSFLVLLTVALLFKNHVLSKDFFLINLDLHFHNKSSQGFVLPKRWKADSFCVTLELVTTKNLTLRQSLEKSEIDKFACMKALCGCCWDHSFALSIQYVWIMFFLLLRLLINYY